MKLAWWTGSKYTGKCCRFFTLDEFYCFDINQVYCTGMSDVNKGLRLFFFFTFSVLIGNILFLRILPRTGKEILKQNPYSGSMVSASQIPNSSKSGSSSRYLPQTFFLRYGALLKSQKETKIFSAADLLHNSLTSVYRYWCSFWGLYLRFHTWCRGAAVCYIYRYN
jgi:hypothetical protein